MRTLQRQITELYGASIKADFQKRVLRWTCIRHVVSALYNARRFQKFLNATDHLDKHLRVKKNFGYLKVARESVSVSRRIALWDYSSFFFRGTRLLGDSACFLFRLTRLLRKQYKMCAPKRSDNKLHT